MISICQKARLLLTSTHIIHQSQLKRVALLFLHHRCCPPSPKIGFFCRRKFGENVYLMKMRRYSPCYMLISDTGLRVDKNRRTPQQCVGARNSGGNVEHSLGWTYTKTKKKQLTDGCTFFGRCSLFTLSLDTVTSISANARHRLLRQMKGTDRIMRNFLNHLCLRPNWWLSQCLSTDVFCIYSYCNSIEFR